MNQSAKLSEYDPSGYQKFRALMAAFIVVCFLAAASALTAIVYISSRGADAAETNQMLLQRVEQTNKRLVSCTAPTGKCFKNERKRIAKSVLGVNEGTMRVIAAALSCQADGLTERKELAQCTTKRAIE